MTDAVFAVPGIEGLAAGRVMAGQPTLGAVTVAYLHAGTARSVRLELVLDDHVPTRPREPLEETCDATAVVAAVPLADHARVEPCRTLRLPFAPRWASS